MTGCYTTSWDLTEAAGDVSVVAAPPARLHPPECCFPSDKPQIFGPGLENRPVQATRSQVLARDSSRPEIP
jgi:hypothetical protein